MFFALAGVANARLRGEHAGVPVSFSLCLGSSQPEGGHDGLDCCLPGFAPAAPAVPLTWFGIGLPLAPEGRDFGLDAWRPQQPLARGPPPPRA